MTKAARKLVVIGWGAAGLAAALSAAEQAGSLSADVDITLIEKAAEDEAGGNTRWSPSYMRMAAPDWLVPPKSNWARPITRPPFLAYPLVGAIAYTFGGIATNARAEVMGESGAIPGLYAAGELTGHFYRRAPNAVAMLRALVFGRIAGREAIEFVTQLADAGKEKFDVF